MKKVSAMWKALWVVLGTAYEMSLLWTNTKINGETQKRNFYHRRRWAKRANRISGIKLDEVLGQDIQHPALVVSNHRTMLDPAVQCQFIDAHIIAKASVGNIPVIGKGAAMTGIVLVKRDKLKSRLAAREMTKQLLTEGKSVLVYAEGTTGTNQTTIPFKIGTFAVAVELGVPVIPVAIEYPEKKDYWYAGALGAQIVQQIGMQKTKVKLRIGDPITGTDAQSLMNQTKSWIDSNLIEMQNGWSQVFSNNQVEQPITIS